MEAANNIGADPDTKVVLAGMANVYTHYITTFEEYQVQVSYKCYEKCHLMIEILIFQRYEGGAVLYGPYTLAAYQQQYRRLTERMLKVSSLLLGQ